jgi:hypothetical protein
MFTPKEGNIMSNIEASSLYDYVKKIQKLSVEDQLKLIELISINLAKNFDIAEENQDEDQIQLSGRWQDNRSADEIVSEIYAQREKNVRSEKAAL